MSTPVCSHTAPLGHARSATPLQYRHWLPKPRQCGAQLDSGRWKTSPGGGVAAAISGVATEIATSASRIATVDLVTPKEDDGAVRQTLAPAAGRGLRSYGSRHARTASARPLGTVAE